MHAEATTRARVAAKETAGPTLTTHNNASQKQQFARTAALVCRKSVSIQSQHP